MKDRFKAGDWVARRVDAYDPSSPIRAGVVTRCYGERSSLGYWDAELYEVCWLAEDGKPMEPLTARGYFRHGLDRLTWQPEEWVCHHYRRSHFGPDDLDVLEHLAFCYGPERDNDGRTH